MCRWVRYLFSVMWVWVNFVMSSVMVMVGCFSVLVCVLCLIWCVVVDSVSVFILVLVDLRLCVSVCSLGRLVVIEVFCNWWISGGVLLRKMLMICVVLVLIIFSNLFSIWVLRMGRVVDFLVGLVVMVDNSVVLFF